MARCRFCQKEIIWIKEGRKNIPVEADGSIHQCEEMKKTVASLKTLSPSSLSPEEIKKYEEQINQKLKKKP